MSELQDGDMDYRIFAVEHGGARQTGFFINNDHWMVDVAGGERGGVLLRPNRAFAWENGKLIVEADVAAGIFEYGDSAAVEIDISTAPAPTGKVTDVNYGYGVFGGEATLGCRFQADRSVNCALFDTQSRPGNPSVFGNELGRVWQVLPFQHVGAVQYGGEPLSSNGHFRACPPNTMDMACRDRFRLELTKDSLKIFVNGMLHFEQSEIPPQYQIPDALVRGENYVYFTSWTNRPLEPVYRFHWDRIAINPLDEDRVPLPPSESPSFGHVM
jgi:hypothetical protein